MQLDASKLSVFYLNSPLLVIRVDSGFCYLLVSFLGVPFPLHTQAVLVLAVHTL